MATEEEERDAIDDAGDVFTPLEDGDSRKGGTLFVVFEVCGYGEVPSTSAERTPVVGGDGVLEDTVVLAGSVGCGSLGGVRTVVASSWCRGGRGSFFSLSDVENDIDDKEVKEEEEEENAGEGPGAAVRVEEGGGSGERHSLARSSSSLSSTSGRASMGLRVVLPQKGGECIVWSGSSSFLLLREGAEHGTDWGLVSRRSSSSSDLFHIHGTVARLIRYVGFQAEGGRGTGDGEEEREEEERDGVRDRSSVSSMVVVVSLCPCESFVSMAFVFVWFFVHTSRPSPRPAPLLFSSQEERGLNTS